MSFWRFFENFWKIELSSEKKNIGNIYSKPSSIVIKLNPSKLMVRFLSRDPQKVKIHFFWELLPKKSQFFHILGHQQQKLKLIFG